MGAFINYWKERGYIVIYLSILIKVETRKLHTIVNII